jgi:hypothetical protein
MLCETEGFYCKTCKCGIRPDGALVPCGKEGCPHCRHGAPKGSMSQRQYEKTQSEHRRALASLIRWEDRLGRALGHLQKARLAERKLRLKLERAEVVGVIGTLPAPQEDVEESVLPGCAACGGTEYTLLGVLGTRRHLRCRACGVERSEVDTNDDPATAEG